MPRDACRASTPHASPCQPTPATAAQVGSLLRGQTATITAALSWRESLSGTRRGPAESGRGKDAGADANAARQRRPRQRRGWLKTVRADALRRVRAWARAGARAARPPALWEARARASARARSHCRGEKSWCSSSKAAGARDQTVATTTCRHFCTFGGCCAALRRCGPRARARTRARATRGGGGVPRTGVRASARARTPAGQNVGCSYPFGGLPVRPLPLCTAAYYVHGRRAWVCGGGFNKCGLGCGPRPRGARGCRRAGPLPTPERGAPKSGWVAVAAAAAAARPLARGRAAGGAPAAGALSRQRSFLRRPAARRARRGVTRARRRPRAG